MFGDHFEKVKIYQLLFFDYLSILSSHIVLLSFFSPISLLPLLIWALFLIFIYVKFKTTVIVRIEIERFRFQTLHYYYKKNQDLI